jgi:predicted transcriptional regulator
MTMTTIKVDSDVRDQFSSVARARGISMAALLREVATELEERQRWAIIEASYERLKREDPQAWAEYHAELDGWDSVTYDPGDAAAEWPEYNR